MTRDSKLSRRINIDYTLSAASAFSKISLPEGKKFRFLYCSGLLAVRDQQKKLWFMEEGRKIRVRAFTSPLLFYLLSSSSFLFHLCHCS